MFQYVKPGDDTMTHCYELTNYIELTPELRDTSKSIDEIEKLLLTYKYTSENQNQEQRD